MKLNGTTLPSGVKVEIIKRDDTGINPDSTKRLAQEPIVREKIQILAGVAWTPNAAAIPPSRPRPEHRSSRGSVIPASRRRGSSR